MEEAIRSAIERQAKKLIERQKRKVFASAKYERRFGLRTGMPAHPANPRGPAVWEIGPHFRPSYCIRHSKYLARTIWKKIQSRTYETEPAIRFKIPKDGGGAREVMVFSIPDAAVANLFNRKLRDRNRNIQSPFCYSYRKDRSIFDAVLHTSSLLKGEKIYVVQYDFSKYFDSIRHEYINFVLDAGDFFVSPIEKYVINKFLEHRISSLKDHSENFQNNTFERRTAGTPQGCSLSLFLSNIASHELDKSLEKQNGMFVRFADDVVSVASSYHDAAKIRTAFNDHCYYSGISINAEKSPGIALLRTGYRGDERLLFLDDSDLGQVIQIDHFDYLGHKFTRTDVHIARKAISRIKKRISRIIYVHLLHNLKRDLFSPSRIGGEFYDWDLVTCINELKLYTYGGLRERHLQLFISGNKRISRFKGLMSFYPLVTRVDQFAELDGWLLSVLRRGMKERSRLLHSKFGLSHPRLTNAKLKSGSWYQFQEGIALETRAPSFVLAWRAARKGFKQYGLTDFEAPKYYSTLGFAYGSH